MRTENTSIVYRLLAVVLLAALLLAPAPAAVRAQDPVGGDKSAAESEVSVQNQPETSLAAKSAAQPDAPEYTTGDADFYLTSDGTSPVRNNEWEYGYPFNPTTGAAASPNCYSSSGGCWGTDLDGNYDDSSDNRLRTDPIATTSPTGSTGLWVQFAHYLVKEESSYDTARLMVDCNGDNSFSQVTSFTSNVTSWALTSWYNLESTNGGTPEFCSRGDNVSLAWFLIADSSTNYAGWYIDNVVLKDRNTTGGTTWLNATFEITTAGACSKLALNEVCYNCNYNDTGTGAARGEWVELYALQALSPGETYFLWDLGDAANSGGSQLQEARWNYAFTVHDHMTGGGGIPAGSRILIYNHLSPGHVGGWSSTSDPFVYYAGSPDEDYDLEDAGDEIVLYVGNGPGGTKCDIATWNNANVTSDYRDTNRTGFSWDENCKNDHAGGEQDVLNAGSNANISISMDPDASEGTPLTRNSSCDWAVSGHNSENTEPQLLAASETRDLAPEANPDIVVPTIGPYSPGYDNNPTLSEATLQCGVLVTVGFDNGLPSNWMVYDWRRTADESDGFTWGSGGLAAGNNSCHAGVTAPSGGGGYACARSATYLHLDAFGVDLRSNTFEIPADVSSVCGGTRVTRTCFNVSHVTSGTRTRFSLRINSVTDGTSYTLQNWDNTSVSGTYCYDIPSIGSGALKGDTAFVSVYYTNQNGTGTSYNVGGYAAVDNISLSCYNASCQPLAVDLASFTAAAAPEGVMLAWETVSETDNAGFNVYRADSDAGPWMQVNVELIPALTPGSSQGNAYTWTDATATAAGTYWYRLEDVALDGTLTQHASVAVTVAAPNAVGLAAFGAAATPSLAGLAALALAALAGVARKRR